MEILLAALEKLASDNEISPLLNNMMVRVSHPKQKITSATVQNDMERGAKEELHNLRTTDESSSAQNGAQYCDLMASSVYQSPM